MGLQHLKELKRLAMHGKDLQALRKFYAQNVAESAEVQRAAVAKGDDYLEALVSAAVVVVKGPKAVSRGLELKHIAAENLFIGSFQVGNTAGALFHFKDIMTSVVAFVPPVGKPTVTRMTPPKQGALLGRLLRGF